MTDTKPPIGINREFGSDNSAGALPQILDAVAAAATGTAPPYGADTIATAI
ncbi:hypothetical protein [Nocardia sp. NPDC052316]|uniref:hypothetical protein n=1 Tax=Nocardia sp. NPDC052316 TaxID=3364329 RepID=UPI0037CA5AF9